ncbi:MAG: M56 family metallopeptidase [Clostridium sp.]|jgi:beta-lactamase regulating signal transducer with metallopeptidase domain|uniref:M56 family metallopeptidase n=1 Tax=Clostridium sp. TaxID=1506 RepID=UPI0025BBB79A|nr:M56 family metallopeptidase [Clostridium sp.]MCH3965193.1 M56 family metallopeptidase [Clostridium sp.]MCI1714413.1 M56 family metallopeptidase [Clostridium sp.]MCI1798675.1 M56 family metallopeptidase [Clostridium sp.]MCI1812594.1 M56 family metallopeptidase [Clostridium sp.]MCI1869484.1 M56 family metallopeptidase [Clostridium sp.]
MKDIFVEVLRTSLLTGILILGIIIMKDKFLDKYSHKFNYFLAVMVIIRMVLVVNIKLDININSFANENYTAYHRVLYNLTQPHLSNIDIIDYTYITMLIWIIGAIGILLYYIYFQGEFYLKVRNNMTFVKDTRIAKILDNEKINLNISKNIKVKIVKGISSPAIIGILNSTIILPAQKFSNNELKWIFRHELFHFKRKDNIIKLLMILSMSLHWFNPLMYIFRKFFNEQCELSCDEAVVIGAKTEDIKEYALLLVKSVRYRNNLKLSTISSQLTDKKVNITKRRIENMLSLKPRKKGMAVIAISLAIVGSSLFALNINKVSATSLQNNTNIVAEKRLNQSNSDYTEKKSVVNRSATVTLETYTYKDAPKELREEHAENCKAVNIEVKDSDIIGKFVSAVWNK